MAAPVGVVLAGGAGRRLGGGKAAVRLGGRFLSDWVVEALATVCDEVAVVAKASTPLPSLTPPVALWPEPDEPRHPLAGIVWALSRAGGRPVLCCPVDVPFVGAASLRRLLAAPGELAVAGGQPLLGRFDPAVSIALEQAMTAGRSVQATVAALGATVVEVPAAELFNVNTPEDLAAAQALIRERDGVSGPGTFRDRTP